MTCDQNQEAIFRKRGGKLIFFTPEDIAELLQTGKNQLLAQQLKISKKQLKKSCFFSPFYLFLPPLSIFTPFQLFVLARKVKNS